MEKDENVLVDLLAAPKFESSMAKLLLLKSQVISAVLDNNFAGIYNFYLQLQQLKSPLAEDILTKYADVAAAAGI